MIPERSLKDVKERKMGRIEILTNTLFLWFARADIKARQYREPLDKKLHER